MRQRERWSKKPKTKPNPQTQNPKKQTPTTVQDEGSVIKY